MVNKSRKYHLYMDETSQFEGNLSGVNYLARPVIYALLVPDEIHNELGKEFIKLRKRNGFSKAIHGIEHFKKKSYKILCKDLVNLTTSSNVLSFAITYEGDLFSNFPAELQDSFAANRFLSMSQTILEYIMFLHPPLRGHDIVFNVKPNSRVIRVSNGNNRNIEDLQTLGFSANKNYKENNSSLYYVWGTDSLRSYLHRMFLDYAPWSETFGQRSWGQVKTIIAQKSKDPFVEWVDISAGIYRWDKRAKLVNKLKKSLSANLQYGPQHQKFKELVHLNLAGNLKSFLSQTLQQLLSFSETSYRTSLQYLCAQALNDISINSLHDLRQLEQYITEILESSRGEHTLVLNIINFLEQALARLSLEEQHQQTVQLLKLRINSHKITIHNHRGEFTQALDAYYDAKDLETSPLDIMEYRERIAIENRLAVSIANVFGFQEGTNLLEPLLENLEKSLEEITGDTKLVLSDPLIGKIRGTLGQNYAFMAPEKPEYFEKAEKLFIQAAQEFSSHADRIRHDINLFHLYCDWQKPEMAQAYIDKISSSETLAPFLQKQNPENARGTQFALLAYIKHCFITRQNFESLLNIFSLDKLKKLFREPVTEHPFQFICAYLARMAVIQGESSTAESFFSHALKIPGRGRRKGQPTLETIRAQILILQALEQYAGQQAKAQENIRKAMEIMSGIGKNSDLEPMLSITGNAVFGWFGRGWLALSSVDWQKDFDIDACRKFLDCFTFNYR